MKVRDVLNQVLMVKTPSKYFGSSVMSKTFNNNRCLYKILGIDIGIIGIWTTIAMFPDISYTDFIHPQFTVR